MNAKSLKEAEILIEKISKQLEKEYAKIAFKKKESEITI